MSILSAEIGKRIQTLGKSQKEVSIAFHDALGRRAKKGEDVDYKTVPPKISKLRKGSPEGESFFFASEVRVAALADALKWKPSDLYALRASSSNHRVLILHPSLWDECSDFLKRQAAQPGASYSCVEVSNDSDDPAMRREELRRVAESNPGCLVVVQGDEDDVFLDGAEIPVTRLEHRPRGWSLVAAPDLVPLPPPDPPRTADSDGMPMANPPGFLAALEGEIEKSNRSFGERWDLFRSEKVFEAVRTALGDARKVEREPTFRIDHLFGWIRKVLPEARVHVVDPAPTEHWSKVDAMTADMAYAALTGSPDETFVWAHGARAFALGPGQQTISRAFHVAGDPVSMPKSLTRLKVYLRDGNPWQPEKKRWKEVCSEVVAECGLKMDGAYARWLEATDVEKQEREIPGDGYPRADKRPARAWTVQLRESALVDKARANLRTLSRRDFNVAWRATSLPFELEAIASAPLIALPLEGRDMIHVVANLGAGKLVRLRTMRFPGEEREPLRVVESAGYYCRLDGGDIHAWMQTWESGLLDGQPLSRVLHQRENRRRRQREDDDRDDD